jgi:hypothetical protein
LRRQGAYTEVVIEKLTLAEIEAIVRAAPEQPVYDWKRSFAPPRDEDGKGEFVKDLMAVANGTAFSKSTGYVFYGVNPDAPDFVVGVSERWDDNEAQALARSAISPSPQFVYYEVAAGADAWIGVAHVEWAGGFFVVARDVGKLREGQCLIRRGSVTRGVTRDDHLKLYLTPGYGYAEQLLQQYGAAAQMLNAQTAHMQENRAAIVDLRRQMESIAGLPPGSLG